MTANNPQSKKIVSKLIIGLIIASLLALVTWLAVLSWPARAVEREKDRLQLQAQQEYKYLNTNYSLDDPKIVIDPYDISPLSALVIFETKSPVGAKVEIDGKDSSSNFSHSFKPATQHRLPIYGLYPDKQNKVKLTVGETTKILTIKTKPLPDNFPKVVNVKNNKAKLANYENQLYFMTPATTKSRTVGYDVNGDVRWYLSTPLTWEIQRLKNGRLLLGTERMVAKPYYTSGMYEMDLLGKVYNEYMIPGGYHHDYHEKQNSNLVVAANNLAPGNKQTVEDYIVELDRNTGKVIKTIDLSKILPMNEGKSLQAWSQDDWFHNNSVFLDEKTNTLLLSGRHQDSVVALDYKTQKIKYIIGSKDSWSKDMQKHFLKPIGSTNDKKFDWQWQQHAATFLPNGDIMLLDNGTNRSKNKQTALKAKDNYSRAVVYRVDEAARTIEQQWQYGKQRGGEYFSPYISDADYLGDNHTLVHSGGVGYKNGVLQNLPAPKVKADKLRSFTTEVINDEVVFEIEVATNNYRAEKMPLYAPSEQSLNLDQPAKRIGSLHRTSRGSTTPVKWYELRPGFFNSAYRQASVGFSQDNDRLTFSGNFHENDVVRLILRNKDVSWNYRVPMKDVIHTNAACLDVFDNTQPRGDKVAINYYVNKTDLSGKYDIYLKINDKTYDTKHKVNF